MECSYESRGCYAPSSHREHKTVCLRNGAASSIESLLNKYRALIESLERLGHRRAVAIKLWRASM
eukprot:12026-Eustigmatos_ZCMA.PRE.1